MDARNYLVRRFALVVAGLFFLSGNSTGCSIDHKPSAKKTDAMVDGSVTDDAQIDANEGEQAGSEAGRQESAEGGAGGKTAGGSSGDSDGGSSGESGEPEAGSGATGGKGGSSAPIAPRGLAYHPARTCYGAGTAIVDNVPTFTGVELNFSITPSLPSGLSLHKNTGVISGTAPSTLSGFVDYTITASNALGSANAQITMAICTAPAAHWAFDEGKGEIANDSSGHEHHGYLQADVQTPGYKLPAWTAGKVGPYALQFDGISNWVDVQPADVFNAQVFTVSAWLYSLNGDDKECSYFTRTGGWILRAKNLIWDIDFVPSRLVTTSDYTFPTASAAAWHHYVITVNNTAKTVNFYVDGAPAGEPKTYTTTFDTPKDAVVFIGAFDYGNNWRWNGKIDDVRFYDKALNLSDIQTLYQLKNPE
jgi:hypothetical protein